MKKRQIYFVTGNLNKLNEARMILHDFNVENILIDLPELQGEAEDIVVEKVLLAAKKAKKPIFVEDVSLCFGALNGLPGPYIKDFLKKLNINGLYDLVSKYKDNSAQAVCMIAFCEPGKKPVLFKGITQGSIVKPRGQTAFGWDPIFLPKGHSKTYAEMDKEEKNLISHRRKALEKFREYLIKNY